MQTQSFEQARLLGAVLKYEQNSNYTRGHGTFKNSTDEDILLQPGIILTGGDNPAIFDTAAPADFTGLCITTDRVLAGQSVPVAWIARGAAIINSNEVDFPADADQRLALESAMIDAGFKLVNGND